MERYQVISCGTNVIFHIHVILAIVYKLILHVIGLVLVCLTTNVKVDVLNDYRYNIAIIIISTVFLMIIGIANYLLVGFVNWSILIWAISIFTSSMTYLGLTFVPKV